MRDRIKISKFLIRDLYKRRHWECLNGGKSIYQDTPIDVIEISFRQLHGKLKSLVAGLTKTSRGCFFNTCKTKGGICLHKDTSPANKAILVPLLLEDKNAMLVTLKNKTRIKTYHAYIFKPREFHSLKTKENSLSFFVVIDFC